jgi:ElaB/YqjD/DUF883 family membrane-anchored ribosome-binding protein
MEEERVMAEQRVPGSGGTSPAQGTAIQVRDTAQEAGAQISDTARQVSETASASYEQGREQIEQVGQYLEDRIREKPLQSVLMAAGIGMIIAFLWKH